MEPISMLLRRLTQHIKNQNWFAVWLDFAIVVVGVFVGIQVSNWNDVARIQSLEKSYLLRIAGELTSNIDTFESETQFSVESADAVVQFLETLKDPTTTDVELVQKMTSYISIGTFLAEFGPSQATFDELKATGNLDIVRDQELREAIIELNQLYDSSRESFDINTRWLMPVDSGLYASFDALRFDQRTTRYFPQQSIEATAQYIREHREVLTRHAALHYWLKDRSIEVLHESIDHSRAVLHRIEEL